MYEIKFTLNLIKFKVTEAMYLFLEYTHNTPFVDREDIGCKFSDYYISILKTFFNSFILYDAIIKIGFYSNFFFLCFFA